MQQYKDPQQWMDDALPVAIGIIFVIVFSIVCGHVWGAEIPKTRAVMAVIGEAEGETYIGKLAVACAIRERGTLRGVFGEHAPRVKKHLYSVKTFVAADRAWEESRDPGNCAMTDHADHWEGTAFPLPSWAKDMKQTAVIGNQRFFRAYTQDEEQEQIDRRHGL